MAVFQQIIPLFHGRNQRFLWGILPCDAGINGVFVCVDTVKQCFYRFIRRKRLPKIGLLLDALEKGIILKGDDGTGFAVPLKTAVGIKRRHHFAAGKAGMQISANDRSGL